jgi:SET family sugar efflux transporter-like MFS transporter
MAVSPLARRLLPLALVFVVVGLGSSFVGPFLALFLSDAVHAGPLHTTFFLMVTPLAGIAVAWLVGRASDRRPIRRRLLIAAAAAGLAGCALTAVVRDYWVLLGLTVTVVALSGTLFPQSFAYARQVLHGHDPGRAAFGISGLRTLFSVAWVCGPPLAALVLAARGFGYTYGFAAIMYAAAALTVIAGLPEVPAPAPKADEVETSAPAPKPGPTDGTENPGPSGTVPPPKPGPTDGTENPGPSGTVPPPKPGPTDGTENPGPSGANRGLIAFTVAGVAAVQTASTLNVQAMPLFVSTDLGGSVRDAGLVLGLCAALEIPMMLGFGALSTRVPLRRLLLFGALCAIAYEAVATTAGTVWTMATAQLLQAAVISTVGALSIPYMQDLMPRHPGRATTLIVNTFPVGQIVAAPMFGLAQHFGYRLAYGLNLGMSVLGLVLLLAARRATPRPAPERLVPTPSGRVRTLSYGGDRARTGGTDSAAGDRRPA